MPVTVESRVPGADEILSHIRRLAPRRGTAAGDGRERVTSGVSGLRPADRRAIATFIQKRYETDMAVKEAEGNKAAFTKPDEDDSGRDIPTDSLEAQIGRPLHANDIIKRLRTLNSNLCFEVSVSFPTVMGIYIPDAEAVVRNGRRLKYVCGFESGISPEFTVRHPDAKGPKKVTRGYTALIRMLAMKGFFSWGDAARAFDITVKRLSLKKELDQARPAAIASVQSSTQLVTEA